MKKIILIAAIALALAGVGAYYEFVYLPPAYGKAVLGVIKDLQESSKDMPRPENVSDPAGKILAVKQQTDFLKKAKERISELRHPLFGELSGFHRDLLLMIDSQLKIYSQAEDKVSFFGAILQIETDFQPKHIDLNTAKMGDMQKHFEDIVPKIKARVDAILAKEPAFELKDVTFSQIKSAWEEASPGFDIWMGFVRRQNPDQPLSAGTPLSPTKEEEGALTKIIKFLDLVKKASASNIDLSQISAPVDKEWQERDQRINKVIDELADKYGK